LEENMEELEKNYYDLTKPSGFCEIEVVEEKPKIKTEAGRFNSIDIRERVDWLERRVDELEKTIALVNVSMKEFRGLIQERFDKMENQEKIQEEVIGELSSLKSIIEDTRSVNDEIKEKMPQMLRELENRVNNFHNKVNSLDKEIKKVEEDYITRPVIIE